MLPFERSLPSLLWGARWMQGCGGGRDGGTVVKLAMWAAPDLSCTASVVSTSALEYESLRGCREDGQWAGREA